MHYPVRLCAIAVCGVLLVSGCALRDPRDSYAYGRVSDGLWDAEYDLLIDWNYPTSSNQGPLVAPQRFKPERPAIGVPWATGNPLVPREPSQAPSLEAASAGAPAHEDSGAPLASVTPDVPVVADRDPLRNAAVRHGLPGR
jgi:hypothetical protein